MFHNINRRKVILLILNALISTLLISSIVYLYYLLSTNNSSEAKNSSNSDIKTFTLDKESSNFMKILSKKFFHENNNNLNYDTNTNLNSKLSNNYKNNYYFTNKEMSNLNHRNFVVYNNQESGENSPSQASSNPTQQQQNSNNDDTIYIDNYTDENYESVENREIVDTPPRTINEPPAKLPAYTGPQPKPNEIDDFDYDSEDYGDDENDLVSSGNGKIILDIKTRVKPAYNKKDKEIESENLKDVFYKEPETRESTDDSVDYKVESVAQEDSLKKPENVYSVSSEILISHVITQNEKQINTDKSQSEKDSGDVSVNNSDDEELGDDEDDWSNLDAESSDSRRSGNVRKSQEKSRQLLLCETAGSGELCRMLFKGSVG